MVDELEQSWTTVHKEYCQNRGQKKPAGKNPSKEKTQQEIWVESMAHHCSEKLILRRLHDWKVTAHYYWARIPTKHGKFKTNE